MNYFNNNDYKDEVKTKWGNTKSYKEYTEKTKNYSKEKYNLIIDSMNNIFKDFSICMLNGESVNSEVVQELVKKLQNYISENLYLCTNEILKNLGQMYILDERFKNNIDKYKEGTALFVNDAISVYCNK